MVTFDLIVLLCFIAPNVHIIMEPDFDTLLRNYCTTKDIFDTQLCITERNFMSDIPVLDTPNVLELLHEDFALSWKRVLLTEEFYEIDTSDLDQSFDSTEQKYQLLLTRLHAQLSTGHDNQGNVDISPPDDLFCLPIECNSPCIIPTAVIPPRSPGKYVPPHRRSSTPENTFASPCSTPSTVITPPSTGIYVPPHRRSPFLYANNNAKPDSLKHAPCPTPSLGEYIPPHRSNSVSSHVQHKPDVIIDMSPAFSTCELNEMTRCYTHPTHSHRNNYARAEPECKLCPEKLHHRLWHCYMFLGMTPYNRLMYVIDNKLCHNCLLSTHETMFCGKNSVCSVPNCGMKHSKYIHVSGFNSDLFTPCFCKNDTSVCDVLNTVMPVQLPSVDFYSQCENDRIDCDEKFRNVQSMLDEMNDLLVYVVDKFQMLKSYFDTVYPGHNASVFLPDVLNTKPHSSCYDLHDQVTLEQVNLQPGHSLSSDHPNTACANSYCNDESIFDSTHSTMLGLRVSAVT